MDDHSDTVPHEARRFEDANSLREIAEPVVWTDSMLQALVEGVQGGKWHSLIDKVWTRATLERAFERVKANGGASGVDHQTIEDFERHLDSNLDRLSGQLQDGTYEPSSVRRTWIPKPGRDEERPLGIPTVEDRIVQMACLIVLEPIFEHAFAERSYGFRPNRGAKDALRRVQTQLEDEKGWVVDADLKSYFDTIPHDQLIERLEEDVSDRSLLDLLECFLKQEVVEDGESWQPEQGTPQGGVISPLLANLYLDALDHLMAERGYEMVRYADDFVILCESREEAEQALELVEQWTSAHGLRLHPDKTRLVEASSDQGCTFLGYQFHKGLKEPTPANKQSLKDEIRARTKRTDGRSLETIIEDVNELSRGWFEYFKHSYWNVFETMDGFIRSRLRAILRWRNDLSGSSSRLDSKRWPNAFFAERGLFSMERARKALMQSLF